MNRDESLAKTNLGSILNDVKEITYTDTFWDDARVAINALKLSGTKPPTWTAYKGSRVLAFSDQAVEANEEIVYFVMQLSHKYKIGSTLEFHVHWVPEDNTAGNVRWLFTYSWADIDGAFPAESTLVVNAATPEVADKHTLSGLGDLTGSASGVSSMILCSLKRNSSNAGDTYTGKDAYLTECDFHFEIDMPGSREEYAK